MRSVRAEIDFPADRMEGKDPRFSIVVSFMFRPLKIRPERESGEVEQVQRAQSFIARAGTEASLPNNDQLV